MNLDKLNGLIVEKRKSKKSIAEEMGISQQALSKKLNGKTRITTDDATMFCDILQITDLATKAEIFLA